MFMFELEARVHADFAPLAYTGIWICLGHKNVGPTRRPAPSFAYLLTENIPLSERRNTNAGQLADAVTAESDCRFLRLRQSITSTIE